MRVVIVEDHALLREGMVALLSENGIDVVAHAADGPGLLQYVEPAYSHELLSAGESGVGYLLNERVSEVRTFLDAVRRVAAGGTALDREVVSSLIRSRDATSTGDRTHRRVLAVLTYLRATGG